VSACLSGTRNTTDRFVSFFILNSIQKVQRAFSDALHWISNLSSVLSVLTSVGSYPFLPFQYPLSAVPSINHRPTRAHFQDCPPSLA
jgi:hypothetical protein